MDTADFFNSQIILENDRVLLRPFLESDINDLEKISYTDGLWEYGSKVKSRNDLEKYVEFCLTARSLNNLYPFAISAKIKIKKESGANLRGGMRAR